MKVKESLNVTFDKTHPLLKTSPLDDDDLVEEEDIKVNETRPLGNDVKDKFLENNEINNIKESKSHPLENVIGTMHLGLWYPKESDIETIVYADSDHAGYYKQTALAIFTTEAEYVSTEKACQQALWIKQALVDYVICLDDIPIMCDNKRAIDLSKNPVQNSSTKHIEFRYHFLRDNVQKGNISIEKVPSEDTIADILTKPFKHEPFNYLRLGIGMMEQND
ncbi:hypothetical protein Tco_0833704 [Tanacetum coccineum]